MTRAHGCAGAACSDDQSSNYSKSGYVQDVRYDAVPWMAKSGV